MALRQLKAENILASGKRLGPADISPKLRDGRSATQGRPDWESGRPAGRECLRVWAAGYPGSMRSSADHIKERATVRRKRRGAQMSEAELHQIRLRLHQGERQKAARGERRLPLPAGLACRRRCNVGCGPCPLNLQRRSATRGASSLSQFSRVTHTGEPHKDRSIDWRACTRAALRTPPVTPASSVG